MCKDPAPKGLGVPQAPLTSSQEDAEKHLSRSLCDSVSLRSCSWAMSRDICLLPWEQCRTTHASWYASEQDSSSNAQQQQRQEEILHQEEDFPFVLTHFKRMNNSSRMTLSWGDSPCYHLIICSIKRDDSNLSLFSCRVGSWGDKYAATKPEWWIIPQSNQRHF